jgi:hypothetical protein
MNLHLHKHYEHYETLLNINFTHTFFSPHIPSDSKLNFTAFIVNLSVTQHKPFQ